MDEPSPPEGLLALPIGILQHIFQYSREPNLFRTCRSLRALFRKPLTLLESRSLLLGLEGEQSSVVSLEDTSSLDNPEAAAADLADSFRLHFFRNLLLESLARPSAQLDAVYTKVFEHPWFDELVAAALVRSKLEKPEVFSLLFLYGVRRERELRSRLADAGLWVRPVVELDVKPDDVSEHSVELWFDADDSSTAPVRQKRGSEETNAYPSVGPRLRNLVLDALSTRFPQQLETHCCCNETSCELETQEGSWTFAEALLAGAEAGDPDVVREAISRGAVWCSRLGELAVLAAIDSDHKGTADLVLEFRGRHLASHSTTTRQPVPAPRIDPITLACELNRHTILPALLTQYGAEPMTGTLPSSASNIPLDIFGAESDEEEDGHNTFGPQPSLASSSSATTQHPTYFDHVVKAFGSKTPRPTKGKQHKSLTPLTTAAMRGFEDSVKALLNHRKPAPPPIQIVDDDSGDVAPQEDVDTQDPLFTMTLPLLYAILYNRHRVVAPILELGDGPATLPYPYPFSQLPLLLGTLVGSRESVIAILEHVVNTSLDNNDIDSDDFLAEANAIKAGDFLIVRLAGYFGDSRTASCLVGWHNFLASAIGSVDAVSWKDVAEVGSRYHLGGMVRWAAYRLSRELKKKSDRPASLEKKESKPIFPSLTRQRDRDRNKLPSLASNVVKLVSRAADKLAGVFGLSYEHRLKDYRLRLKEEFGEFAPTTDPRGLPFIFGFSGCGLALKPISPDDPLESRTLSTKDQPGFLACHPGLPPPMRYPNVGNMLRSAGDIVAAIGLLGSMLSVDAPTDDAGQQGNGQANAAGGGQGNGNGNENEQGGTGPLIPDGMVLADGLESVARAVDLESVD